ncbi:MAG: iron ABC transporter permease [Clostridia bacterium]|nr:iron ABC transporter permease [Clostridia bacterium]
MKNLRRTKKRIIYAYAAGLAMLFCAVLLGISLGGTDIKLAEIFSILFSGETDSADARILYYVRLPRTLAGIICGAALAVSGAVIQGTLANKLASPSIIGVSSGAGLAVTLCSAFGILGGWRLSLFSFLGAFLTVMLVSLGAKRRGASRGTLILMGVAINSLLGAVSDAVITFTPEIAVMSTDFKVGDLSSVTYSRLVPAAVVVSVALILLFTLSNELDVLTLGDENARGLGLNTRIMRPLLLMLAAALAASAVSIAGLLSFVGLLVPHAVRRLSGGAAKHLLPLSAIFGAGFLTLCDTLARVVFAPYEIPVGIIMAFLGAPFFLFILLKKKGDEDND